MRRWEVDLTSHEQWIYLYTYISRCLELCIGGCWRNRSGMVTYLRRAGGFVYLFASLHLRLLFGELNGRERGATKWTKCVNKDAWHECDAFYLTF